MTLTGR